MKGEGKFYLLKKILPLLEDLYFQKQGILVGELETAFDFNNNEILENFLNSKIKIRKKRINKDLILGGVFRTKDLEVDFSFKNLFEKWRI
jgi:F0F1-type ATP synthase delta subunit